MSCDKISKHLKHLCETIALCSWLRLSRDFKTTFCNSHLMILQLPMYRLSSHVLLSSQHPHISHTPKPKSLSRIHVTSEIFSLRLLRFFFPCAKPGNASALHPQKNGGRKGADDDEDERRRFPLFSLFSTWIKPKSKRDEGRRGGRGGL